MNRIQSPMSGNNKTRRTNKRLWRGPIWKKLRAGRSSRRTGCASATGSARKSATRPSRPGSARSSWANLKAGKLRLYAPTRFVRDWVARHYGDRVLAYWQAVNAEVATVEVNLVPPPAPRRPNEIIAVPPVPSPQNYQPPMPRMGPVDRPRRRRHLPGAGGALHLRQLRGRQAQRVRLCRRAQYRRAGPAAAGTQPALYFRRRRARQDPSDARHLALPSASAIPRRACSTSRPKAS